MGKVITDTPLEYRVGILSHHEGVDLLSANIELSCMEVSLINALSRETILKQYLDSVKKDYQYSLLDTQPSLGMLTVNALAAADSVIIPVLCAISPCKGLEQLFQTINKVRKQINPKLQIDGILLTMVDNRTNYAKDISTLLRDIYGGKFENEVTKLSEPTEQECGRMRGELENAKLEKQRTHRVRRPRPFEQGGIWGAKQKKEYVLDEQIRKSIYRILRQEQKENSRVRCRICIDENRPTTVISCHC